MANFDFGEPGLDRPGAIAERAKNETLKMVAYALLRQAYGVAERLTPPDPGLKVEFFREVRQFQVSLIKQALLYAHGRQAAAARLLKLHPATLHYKIKQYGIEIPMTTNDAAAGAAAESPLRRVRSFRGGANRG